MTRSREGGRSHLRQLEGQKGRGLRAHLGVYRRESGRATDWTTFETIGGLRPTQDNLLEYELNRSNFDRAFGQLFTVLSGHAVVLPYARGNGAAGPIVLIPEGVSPPIDPADPVEIPQEWRIVATMNVFDKTLLFEMSYALMRRFAFIEVSSPPSEVFEALIDREASGNSDAADLAKRLLDLRELKDLGPAVFMDIARYLNAREFVGEPGTDGQLLFEVFYSYLLPQFEGVDALEGEALFNGFPALSAARTSGNASGTP